VYYNFNKPEELDSKLHHQFTMVVIDPPFITREVWEKYAEACRLLLCDADDVTDVSKNGAILLSTIAENQDMMNDLLNVTPVVFQPSIPNLVYQYNLYSNYNSERLSTINDEISQ
jgi:16S rRNA G966 N2-methylase RsmD